MRKFAYLVEIFMLTIAVLCISFAIYSPNTSNHRRYADIGIMAIAFSILVRRIEEQDRLNKSDSDAHDAVIEARETAVVAKTTADETHQLVNSAKDALEAAIAQRDKHIEMLEKKLAEVEVKGENE